MCFVVVVKVVVGAVVVGMVVDMGVFMVVVGCSTIEKSKQYFNFLLF